MLINHDVGPSDQRRALALVAHLILHDEQGVRAVLEEAATEDRSEALTLAIAAQVSGFAVAAAGGDRRIASARWSGALRHAAAREAAFTSDGEN